MRRSIIMLIIALALALLAAPLATEAQQAGKVYRVGLLRDGSPPDPNVEAFRQGLRELGYVEGQNIAIEYRWAEGKRDRLPGLAAELVALKVDLIVTAGTTVTRAAKQATGTIPIVMAAIGDPVAAGLVASLAHPGGNITGLSILGPELAGKRLQLLKELLPGLSRVAVLSTLGNPHNALEFQWVRVAAQALGVELELLELRDPDELESAVNRVRPDALVTLSDPALFDHRSRVVNLAAAGRLPAIYEHREYVAAGGLMSYARSQSDLHRRAAAYVDKILKGAKPADLSIEQPTKFELVINLKTAKALGLTIPQSLFVLADRVIE